MKTIVVGDLHGKYQIVEALLEFSAEGGDNIRFIGDYLDSFTHKPVEQLHTLDLVLDAVKTSDGRVKALLGNHEMAYLNPHMSCSGNTMEVTVGLLTRDLSPLLTHCWEHEDILLTHAGISQKLLDELTWESKNKVSAHQYIEAGKFNQIGQARKGRDIVGGLYWCDWWKEFEPVIGIRQIVGHTTHRPFGRNPGIITKGDNYNIDCLDRVPQVLIIDEEGEISYETLEDIDGY